jgi:hypothetical protein
LRRQAANLIVAGEIFLLEVQGERRMMRLRMQRKEGGWYAFFSGQSEGSAREKPPDVFAAGVRDSRLSRAAADGVKMCRYRLPARRLKLQHEPL